MEDLSLEDAAPRGGQNQAQNAQNAPQQPSMPPMAQQLPPQMFTTAAQLLDLTDKKLMVVLRDGRKLIGVLRSWDQFANLVLQDTIERIFVQDLYADIKRGLFLVRGENVLLLGEIDLDQDEAIPEPYKEAPAERVHAIQKEETEKRKKREKARSKLLRTHGFEGEYGGETIL